MTIKDRIKEFEWNNSKVATEGFVDGIEFGIEFACAHLCEHCADGDKPERISQEQIDLLIKEASDRPPDWLHTRIENNMWRHSRRKDKKSQVEITPLCESSSLREAWREDDEVKR